MCIQLGLLQRLEAMACEATAGARPPPDGEVRLGTWNVSHWSAVKADLIATTIGASILAVQETHLAPLPLEWAHTTARHLGLHLHHGRAAVPMANSPHGRSCGVGFVATSGVALSPVLPLGSPSRMLHSVRRLHAVQLPPRLGLPHGLLLLSVYAPLQERQLSAERARFVDAMLAVTHTLDMQVPTLLMGDFNGALIPAQDCRGTHPRPPCPLLSQLLGPGGAWVDVHAALLQPPLPWTFHSLGQSQLGASRIDLVLANHAAMPFLQSASVLSDLRDGGHSPVLVTLRFPSAATLVWHQPQPRLPALLLQPSSVLLSSKEWAALMERWLPSTAAQLAVNAAQPHSVHSLARALVDALQHLVTLSGGWSSRPPHRRPAYDSADVRRLRRRLTLLHRLQRLLQPPAPPSPGCWPRPWLDILQQLHRLGISLLATTVPDLLSEALLASAACRRDLDALVRKMRRDRQARWRCTLADAWRERPGVVHHWLHAPRPQWGTSPIVNDAGWQCTSVSEVDATVRKFWVESVLRRHDPAEDGRCWARFMESAFYSHIPSMSWPSRPWDGD